MNRVRAAALAVVAITITLTASTLPASPGASARAQRIPPPGDAPVTGGTVIGTARKTESVPYVQALVRLRDVSAGHSAGLARADERGGFRFEQVPPGQYVVELISAGEAIVAVGEPFAVIEGETASTSARVPLRDPWFSGFFGNAAAAALATASSVGITAVGSSGRPASPQ